MLELICYIAAVAILIAFTLVAVSVCGFFLLIMSKNTLEIYGKINYRLENEKLGHKRTNLEYRQLF